MSEFLIIFIDVPKIKSSGLLDNFYRSKRMKKSDKTKKMNQSDKRKRYTEVIKQK